MRARGQSRVEKPKTASTHLVRHDVAEQTGVARVNAEAVRAHRVVDLLDDRAPGGLDTEDDGGLHDLRGRQGNDQVLLGRR